MVQSPPGCAELPHFALLHPDGRGLGPRCCPLPCAKRTGPGTRTHTCKQRESGSILPISLLSRTAGAAKSPGKAVGTAPSASPPAPGLPRPPRAQGSSPRAPGEGLRPYPMSAPRGTQGLQPQPGVLTPHRLQKRAGAARRRARCFVSPWERNADLPIAFFSFFLSFSPPPLFFSPYYLPDIVIHITSQLLGLAVEVREALCLRCRRGAPGCGTRPGDPLPADLPSNSELTGKVQT